MENLRIFDTFEDYIDYKESPDFEMPSANAVHNTQYGYDLMFIDNGINHNIISYVMAGEYATDTIFNQVSTIFNENILLKADYKGIKYLVLDTPLHKFINSTDNTFAGSEIMSIKLPDTIKEISENTFDGCQWIKQIILPDYLEKIHYAAFLGCAELQEIIIPKYVKIIEDSAFYDCGIQTLDFKSKHLENLTIDTYAFCLLPLKTIITRSKLPFNVLSVYSSFSDCGTNISNKRFYLPFNFDEDAYQDILGTGTLKSYNVSHKISNLSGNITCNIGSAPLNKISTNIGAISHSATKIMLPVIYGGAAFYDVLGEEYITTTKNGILQVPITSNTTFNTKNHTVTFCRNILNVDTGQDLVISGSVSIPQWGKPRYRIEYTDDSTGWYNLGTISIPNVNPWTSSNIKYEGYTVFRNRNSNMHSTSSKMRIYFKNIINPKFYVNNYAETTYDYIQISALDKTISQGVSTTLSGKQYPNYSSNFTLASFNINDDEEHFVEVAFRKDGSANSNDDAGYINFKFSDISDKTFEVTENHRFIGSYSIEHNNFRNPLYNGNITNINGAYTHGLQSGTTGMNNTPVYLYNVYNLVLDKISGEYSSKNGTNANYLLTYHVIDAKSGLYTTPDKLYIPYHKSGTTASTQTTFIDTNSAIRVRGFYDNNSMYFDVKQNGFDVKNRITINSTWNSAATNFPDWYLAINDYATVTNAHGIHTVNLAPYNTLTYSTNVTLSSGATTFVYANYNWTQCATTATKIAPQQVIPNVNFGKLYMSGNSSKNNSVSLMTINITGYKKFTMYVRSSGQSSSDYIVISKPNVTISNFMTDVCQRSYTPTNYTYLTLKGKATPSSMTKSLYSASAFIKVEFNLADYIYTTPTCQIICAFVKDYTSASYHDAGFIYIPN